MDTVAVGAATAPTTEVRTQAAADARLLSIETYLRPSVRAALKDAGSLLAAGGLVAIRDAFEPDFAERIYRSLDSCTTWRLHEGYEEHFHYHHHNVYEFAEFPADLAWCSKIFDSSNTKEWVTRLSARSCLGPAEVSASWYLPGDHSLPHNDIAANDASSNRQVAFVWHLADWRSEWGGALFWCLKDAIAARLQHSMAIQRGAGIEPLCDSRLTVRPGQAPRGQWMVDGTDRNTQSNLRPDRIRTDSSEIVITIQVWLPATERSGSLRQTLWSNDWTPDSQEAGAGSVRPRSSVLPGRTAKARAPGPSGPISAKRDQLRESNRTHLNCGPYSQLTSE